MNKLFLPIILTGLLAGCASQPKLPTPEVHVVKQVEYIVRVPPKELMTLPNKPADIDVNTATQATVAQWIIDSEEYTDQLKNKLILIAKFLTNQQANADKQAQEQNSKAANTLGK